MLLGLAREQQRRGDHPVIVSIAPPDVRERPIEAMCGSLGLPCIRHRMRDGFNLQGARELLSLLTEQSADIVHSHGYKSNILLSLTRRQFPQVCLVTTLHGWTATRAISRLGLYRWLDQRLLARLDGVVVVNRKMLGLPAIARLDAGRVAFIPNGIANREPRHGVEDAADPLRDRLLALKAQGHSVIGTIGRLSPEKNVAAMLGSMARLVREFPDLRLLIIGEGPQEPFLRHEAALRGLKDNIVFAGFRSDAREYLPLLDILALPSLTEGLPMTLLEAMLEGVPVVATRVGEMPHVLQDAGQLVEPGDVEDLSQALARTLRDLPVTRDRAAKAVQRIREEYSVGRMADRYADFYGRILGSRSIE